MTTFEMFKNFIEMFNLQNKADSIVLFPFFPLS